MHCILYRPSARFFQIPFDERHRSSDVSSAPSKTEQTLASGVNAFGSHHGFHTKEERLAHVDERNTIFIDVTIDSDVVGHLSGGHPGCVIADPLSITMQPRLIHSDAHSAASPKKVPTVPEPIRLLLGVAANGNVNATIGAIFESWLELRKRSGLNFNAPHPDSLYSHLTSRSLWYTMEGASTEPRGDDCLFALGLLESDLALAACDATGRVVKRLKRVYLPKGGSGPAAASPTGTSLVPQPVTPTSLGSALVSQDCALTGKLVAQKNICVLLSSIVDVPGDGSAKTEQVSTGVAAASGVPGKRAAVVSMGSASSPQSGEASFKPPYFIKLFIPEDRALIRRLMLKEHIFRLRMESEVFQFYFGFAKPYWDQCLTPGIHLRQDWSAFEAITRSRLAQSELVDRWECQNTTLTRLEATSRGELIQEETQSRNDELGKWHERLTFCAIASASRSAMVEVPEAMRRSQLEPDFNKGLLQWRLISNCREKLEAFAAFGGPAMAEEVWLLMCNELHSFFKQGTLTDPVQIHQSL